MNLHVVSQNMSINNGDPERRWADFSEVALTSRPHILLLQEVSADVGYTALKKLASKLGSDFTLHYETVYPGQEDEQGVAIVSQLPIARSYTTNFTNVGNQSQIAELSAKDASIVVGNVHQRAAPQEENQRLNSVAQLSKLFEADYSDTKKLLAGDFNAMPFYPTILSVKRKGYRSAYKDVHGHEPKSTFPTMSGDQLIDGGYLKAEEVEKLKRVAKIAYAFSSSKPELPAYTTDYIFAKDLGRILTASLVVAAEGSPEAISDHKGVSASFAI